MKQRKESPARRIRPSGGIGTATSPNVKQASNSNPSKLNGSKRSSSGAAASSSSSSASAPAGAASKTGLTSSSSASSSSGGTPGGLLLTGGRRSSASAMKLKGDEFESLLRAGYVRRRKQEAAFRDTRATPKELVVKDEVLQRVRSLDLETVQKLSFNPHMQRQYLQHVLLNSPGVDKDGPGTPAGTAASPTSRSKQRLVPQLPAEYRVLDQLEDAFKDGQYWWSVSEQHRNQALQAAKVDEVLRLRIRQNEIFHQNLAEIAQLRREKVGDRSLLSDSGVVGRTSGGGPARGKAERPASSSEMRALRSSSTSARTILPMKNSGENPVEVNEEPDRKVFLSSDPLTRPVTTPALPAPLLDYLLSRRMQLLRSNARGSADRNKAALWRSNSTPRTQSRMTVSLDAALGAATFRNMNTTTSSIKRVGGAMLVDEDEEAEDGFVRLDLTALSPPTTVAASPSSARAVMNKPAATAVVSVKEHLRQQQSRSAVPTSTTASTSSRAKVLASLVNNRDFASPSLLVSGSLPVSSDAPGTKNSQTSTTSLLASNKSRTIAAQVNSWSPLLSPVPSSTVNTGAGPKLMPQPKQFDFSPTIRPRSLLPGEQTMQLQEPSMPEQTRQMMKGLASASSSSLKGTASIGRPLGSASFETTVLQQRLGKPSKSSEDAASKNLFYGERSKDATRVVVDPQRDAGDDPIPISLLHSKNTDAISRRRSSATTVLQDSATAVPMIVVATDPRPDEDQVSENKSETTFDYLHTQARAQAAEERKTRRRSSTAVSVGVSSSSTAQHGFSSAVNVMRAATALRKQLQISDAGGPSASPVDAVRQNAPVPISPEDREDNMAARSSSAIIDSGKSSQVAALLEYAADEQVEREEEQLFDTALATGAARVEGLHAAVLGAEESDQRAERQSELYLPPRTNYHENSIVSRPARTRTSSREWMSSSALSVFSSSSVPNSGISKVTAAQSRTSKDEADAVVEQFMSSLSLGTMAREGDDERNAGASAAAWNKNRSLLYQHASSVASRASLRAYELNFASKH
ncbi:unnamed protein product [Amoebophrya sp. A120]|nr:unnamed protein product [Amoebophrya sp. A120]|eukprot:GSA120T00025749001.1